MPSVAKIIIANPTLGRIFMKDSVKFARIINNELQT